MLMAAVRGRELNRFRSSSGGGTIPHVFGRYTFSFVQCVGPALCVLTPTPAMEEKIMFKRLS